MTTATRPEARNPSDLLRCAKLLWQNLAMVLVSSTIVAIAGTAVVILGRGITPISMLLWGLVVGPLFAGFLTQVNELVCGHAEPSTFSFFRYLRRSWRTGMVLGILPGFTGALAVVAIEVFRQTHASLALPPIAAAVAGTALGCVVYIVGIPMRVEHPGLRIRDAMKLALHITARRPVPVVGIFALIGIVVWAAAQFSSTLLLILPAPLAFVTVAAVWTAARGSGVVPRPPDAELLPED